ncbi:hypothetical protein SDC9_126130 [bioreactor metagenome]|uniref:Uncharacterized protein n=1 Tax=bioreactor metagenome TaxID=1076179 RepID=A0A645CQC2_9ZZZZ
MNDHLRLLVGGGLEQHRVEIGMRRQAAGQRLQCLRPPDLAAIDGHRRIERHVLRLERRHTHATALENATQGGNQRGLAGIGGGPLDHQGRTEHGEAKRQNMDYRGNEAGWTDHVR